MAMKMTVWKTCANFSTWLFVCFVVVVFFFHFVNCKENFQDL